MKKWLNHIRSSFSARLSLWVTAIVAAIFVVVYYLISQFSLTIVREESLQGVLLTADYKRLQSLAVVTVIVGIALLLVVCRSLTERMLRPLEFLAETMRRLGRSSEGDLNHDVIQPVERKDEIGGLQSSFATMQLTLEGYIHEISQKTESLKQRQKELEEAYEHAREDERVKTTFLNHISQQIGQPVNAIQILTTLIASDYQHLPKEEMSRLRAVIMSKTNEITQLIDQRLISSQQTEHPQAPTTS
jgi:methyl-accepting chemotaxis protein